MTITVHCKNCNARLRRKRNKRFETDETGRTYVRNCTRCKNTIPESTRLTILNDFYNEQ